MNSMSLKDKIKNIANEKNVEFNSMLRMYMYDRFIERLALSKYKDNFILKGGFYLSTLFGIENRSTRDIDTAIKGADFTKENIIKMISEIINIDINDNCTIEIVDIDDIRQEDEYGGYRFTLLVRFENIREQFQIDIATGDPITPKEIVYKYLPLLGNEYINLWSYNLETVLAEKLETILNRAETSSRLRDYYDIYLIYKMYSQNINYDNFRKAVTNTFKKREYNGDMFRAYEVISNSDILKIKWKSYARKNKYAENISYEDIIECLDKLIKVLEPVSV